MRAWLRRWWPALKVVLVVAVLAAVGVQLARDLAKVEWSELEVRPGWLAAAGLLYLAALGFSAWCWYWLLRTFGQRPAFLTAVRAYYLGHLGKYLPGKAWALFMRGAMVQGPDVRLGVAIILAFYEVLTTMTAGALVAAVLFAWQPPTAVALAWDPKLLGMLLVAIIGVPLLPGVFNWLVGRLAARFETVEAFQLPRLRMVTLIEGLAATGCGWGLLGLSLWATHQAILAEPQELTVPLWARYTAMIGLAYVAGFLVVFLPSGVGVREVVLQALLTPELHHAGLASAEAAGLAALAVVLLRVAWTTAELVAAAGLYSLPHPKGAGA
jgi:uncharacterized membrane protein YbhN (UPF0104 family)